MRPVTLREYLGMNGVIKMSDSTTNGVLPQWEAL